MASKFLARKAKIIDSPYSSMTGWMKDLDSI